MSAPRERPILFSAPMVRALLAGTKTQTRRAVKTHGAESFDSVRNAHMGGPGGGLWWDGYWNGSLKCNRFRCPYGAPGDRLWVRETCIGEELADGQDGVRYPADSAFRPIENSPAASIAWLKLHTYRGHNGARIGPKVPGIHMPRLEITDVRVERLQDITEADALAEGVIACRGAMAGIFVVDGCRDATAGSATEAYGLLWDHINGPGAWEANPWIWAVSFLRVTP